jgi:hypothetical protein
MTSFALTSNLRIRPFTHHIRHFARPHNSTTTTTTIQIYSLLSFCVFARHSFLFITQKTCFLRTLRRLLLSSVCSYSSLFVFQFLPQIFVIFVRLRPFHFVFPFKHLLPLYAVLFRCFTCLHTHTHTQTLQKQTNTHTNLLIKLNLYNYYFLYWV